MTVSHLTPYVGAGTLDHFPVANHWLVEDLERVLEIIAADLEAEQAAGGTALVRSMQNAAQHLAKPVTDTKQPFTW
jgi:hypothetical protein